MTDDTANLSRFTALSKLLKFAKPERRRLIWGTVCLAISSSLTLIFPQAVREALDQALNHGDVAGIDRIGLAMMAILITTAITSAARYYLFTYSGERTVRAIKAQLFQSLLRQDVGYFDSQMTGDLLSRLTTDASVLQNALSVNISMLLRNLASAIGGLVLMIITAPKLTLVLLAALPPAAVVVARFGGQIRGTSRQVQEALGIASAVADETLTNIRTCPGIGTRTDQENWQVHGTHFPLGSDCHCRRTLVRSQTGCSWRANYWDDVGLHSLHGDRRCKRRHLRQPMDRFYERDRGRGSYFSNLGSRSKLAK